MCFQRCSLKGLKSRLNNSLKLGSYIPYSSARVIERALPLSPRSCCELGSNSQPIGHKLSTVPEPTSPHHSKEYKGRTDSNSPTGPNEAVAQPTLPLTGYLNTPTHAQHLTLSTKENKVNSCHLTSFSEQDS